MRRETIGRVLPAAVLVAASGTVSAAGFQLLEQNASGIGNAYAGSAAVAENASTIYFNPAGMTQLQARELSLGVSAVRPSFKFDNEGSAVLNAPRIPTSGGDGDDAGSWAGIPNGYLSWALGKDIYAGIGLGAPFGLITDYDDDWVGRAQSRKFEIKTYNVNPSIAFRVNDKVSVGAGLSWQRLDAEYVRSVSVLPNAIAPVPGLAATTATLDADSDDWGWNVGVLLTPSPGMRIGLSYRSKIEHELEGKLKVSGAAAGLAPTLRTVEAEVDVELPDTFVASVAQRLDARWELLGDVSWTGWSSLGQVHIVRSSGPLAGSIAQTLEADFQDTWRVALGANYTLNDALKLKFGVAYDESPVKDKQRRLTSLPDNDRTWFTVGGQWKLDAAKTLDLGVAYLYVPDTKIDNDQTAAGRGRVTGEYSSSVWIVGAQYSIAF